MHLSTLIPFHPDVTRETPLSELGVEPALLANLAAAGVTTAGDVDDWRGRFTRIKGVSGRDEYHLHCAVYRMRDEDYDDELVSPPCPAVGGNTPPGI